MEKHLIIECDCKSTLVRLLSKQRESNSRLNNIEDSISKIFDLLDKLDDISSVTVALNQQAEQIKNIAANNTQ